MSRTTDIVAFGLSLPHGFVQFPTQDNDQFRAVIWNENAAGMKVKDCPTFHDAIEAHRLMHMTHQVVWC